MGQVVQGGSGQAPARQAAIHGGVPPTAGAMTINKVCGSGLKAVMLAAQSIRAGDQDVFHRRWYGVNVQYTAMSSMAPNEAVKFGHQKMMDIMITRWSLG